MTYIYLHGFASSPRSTKARHFAAHFANLGIPLAVPDLAPDFESLTLSGQIDIVRKLMYGAGEVTLIGSSMGGYVSALTALDDSRVKAVVLMAPAFGFSRRWAESLGGEKVEQWQRTGSIEVYHYGDGKPRNLGYQLVADALQFPDYPNISQPSLLLHGIQDTVVPISHSEEFVSRGPNRKLVVFESGHELGNVLDSLWTETVHFLGLPVPTETYKKS